MTRSLIALFFVFVLLLSPFASAGTLISGSSMDVQSNFGGLSGLSLVGTWSTTPTVNDRVIISNLIVPDPYEIKSTAEVTFNQPVFEQVFEVRTQKRLLTATVVDRTFNYFPALTTSGSLEKCIAAWDSYRATTEQNRELFPGFQPVRLALGLGSCRLVWVTTEQTGTYGKVENDRIFYKQDVVVQGVGTMTLERSATRDSLVATIPGVARVALLNFGQYTSAQLSDNQVYAFQPKSGTGALQWKPFTSVTEIVNYETSVNQLAFLDDQLISGQISYVNFVTQLETARANLNSNGQLLVQKSFTLPSEWQGRTSSPPRTQDANLIIVEPRKDTFTANVQFALRGERVGLFIPTGECSIVSAASSVQWLETEQGKLRYTIRNTGTDTASIGLSATCTGSNVNAVPQDISLAAGAQQTGDLLLTGRSSTLDLTQSFSCTLTCLEKNTQKTATKAFTSVLERKQLCAEGEQTAPKLVGTAFVVDTLNADCQVKSQTSCDALTKSFVQESGVWTCVDKAATGGIGQGEAPEAPREFNFTVFAFAMLLGIVGGAFAFAKTHFLVSMSRYSTLWRVVIALGVFVAIAFLVAGAVNYVIALFSFAF